MSKDKPLWVISCPLCRIFSHDEVVTKLYYPEKKEEIKNSDFVIVDCKTCKVPMVIFKNHVTAIDKVSWGKLLYLCRNLFGKGTRLKNRPRTIKDHFHCHIYENVK